MKSLDLLFGFFDCIFGCGFANKLNSDVVMVSVVSELITTAAEFDVSLEL